MLAPTHFYLPVLLAALVLSSCSQAPVNAPAEADLLVSGGFENLDGWLADVPALATLTHDKAHSGSYSTRVSPEHEFSLGYSNQLSKLSPNWPARLTIGAWVLLPNAQATAKLVTEVKGPDNTTPSLLWEGLDLTKTVKVFNDWQYVERTITLPATARADSRLLVYLWRADSQQPVYLDDLKISLAR